METFEKFNILRGGVNCRNEKIMKPWFLPFREHGYCMAYGFVIPSFYIHLN